MSFCHGCQFVFMYFMVEIVTKDFTMEITETQYKFFQMTHFKLGKIEIIFDLKIKLCLFIF